jgi:flagellar basal-body rod protein FlgF
MDRLVYLAMAGAKASLQRQDVLAHNLANASTPGFRAELQAFRAVPVRGDGASTRVYVLESTVGHDMKPGPVQTTGRPLDVAPQGRTWLAVQTLDGTEAYTRAGALQVDDQGQLVTPAGLPLVGDGGPIALPPGATVDIASDGTVTAQTSDAPPQVVGRLKLVSPEGPLQRGADGLFRAPGGDLEADPAARVAGGALEGSNVSPVESMVAMISAARQFEQQMRTLKDAQQREQGASRLLGQGT